MIPENYSQMVWHVASVSGPMEEALAFLALQPRFAPKGERMVRRGLRGPYRAVTWWPMHGYVFTGDLAGTQARMARARRLGNLCPLTGFLGMNGQPSPVRPAAMAALFAAQESGRFDDARADGVIRRNCPQIGEKVLAQVGNLADVEGVVKAVQKGDMIEITTQLFGRQMNSKVPLDRIVRAAL